MHKDFSNIKYAFGLRQAVVRLRFPLLLLLFYFFYFFLIFILLRSAPSCRMLSVSVHGTHYLFDSKISINVQGVLCIVHRTHKPLFSTKLSLKIGLTALFIHLKIILLQYFQISIFNKINGIQTDPKLKKELF